MLRVTCDLLNSLYLICPVFWNSFDGVKHIFESIKALQRAKILDLKTERLEQVTAVLHPL